MPNQPSGWQSRGHLPHLDVPCLLQSITFRLFDSLRHHVMERIYATTSPDNPERLRQVERLLDAGRGACSLGKAEIAEESVLHSDGQRYPLLCWVVMPNHVHTLIDTLDGHPLPDVVHSWKSFAANVSNRRLGRPGHFWAWDYFDRYIRDDKHLAAAIRYIPEVRGVPARQPSAAAMMALRRLSSSSARLISVTSY